LQPCAHLRGMLGYRGRLRALRLGEDEIARSVQLNRAGLEAAFELDNLAVRKGVQQLVGDEQDGLAGVGGCGGPAALRVSAEGVLLQLGKGGRGFDQHGLGAVVGLGVGFLQICKNIPHEMAGTRAAFHIGKGDIGGKGLRLLVQPFGQGGGEGRQVGGGEEIVRVRLGSRGGDRQEIAAIGVIAVLRVVKAGLHIFFHRQRAALADAAFQEVGKRCHALIVWVFWDEVSTLFWREGVEWRQGCEPRRPTMTFDMKTRPEPQTYGLGPWPGMEGDIEALLAEDMAAYSLGGAPCCPLPDVVPWRAWQPRGAYPSDFGRRQAERAERHEWDFDARYDE